VAVFQAAPEGYWRHLLPEEEGEGDLMTATGCKWEELLPLLLEKGVMKLSRPACASKYEAVKATLDVLRNRFWPMGDQLEFTNYRPGIQGQNQRSQSSSYYFCHGIPSHKNPQQQVEAHTRCLNLELQILDADVTRRLRQFRQEVHTRELERCVQDASEQTPSPGCKKKLSKEELITKLKLQIGETIRKQLLVAFAEEAPLGRNYFRSAFCCH
jgi:hypothetical protein